MSLAGQHILLCEDNDINQEILLGLLEESGINIDIAENGKIGVAKAKERQYGLILMDIQMPVMDGLDATRAIREFDPRTPIVALTANALKEQIDETRQAGMNAHLGKPIDVTKLYQTILCYLHPLVEQSSSDIERLKQDGKRDLNKAVSEYAQFQFNVIDASKGARHFAGNINLYEKVLKDFYRTYETLSLDIKDTEEKLIILHTMKGLAGNIGADKLYRQSIDTERALTSENI